MATPHPPKASHRAWLVRFVLPLAAGVVTLTCVWFWAHPSGTQAYGFPLDDSWTHMVYARELAETGLLAYNPGIPATEATSPLWVGFLALVQLVVGRPSLNGIILTVYVAGSLCFLWSIYLLTRLTAVITAFDWPGTVAGIVLAISPAMASAAFSGMEVLLCAVLLKAPDD